MVTTLALIAIWGAAPKRRKRARNHRSSKPTTVSLDFHDRSISEVIKAIGERSGKRVTDQFRNTDLKVVRRDCHRGRPESGDRPDGEKHELAATARDTRFGCAGAFWEAVDRLADVGEDRLSGGQVAAIGESATEVIFQGKMNVRGLWSTLGRFGWP